MTDYKNFKAARGSWKLDALFVGGLIVCLGAVMLIPEQQGAGQAGNGASNGAYSTEQQASVPYQPCPKLRRGKWLRYEIAQQTPQGWMIECHYEGDGALFAKDEVRL